MSRTSLASVKSSPRSTNIALHKIQELEAQLDRARNDRTQLEDTIRSMSRR